MSESRQITTRIRSRLLMSEGNRSKRWGDQATACRWYEEFLTIWRDADPDIPLLKQAKAEYSKLH
jgi:hypothetical protein